MKRNRAGYFIKEGVNSIFTHGFMSFATVCIIVACLIIMGSFTLLAFNMQHIITNLEQQNQVVAFVDDSLEVEQAKALQSRIEALPNVSSVQFITRDQAFDTFLAEYEDNRLFEDIDSTVFRHRYVVALDDLSLMSDTQKQLLSISGIAKVNAHLEISSGFVTLKNVVSIISIVLIVVLFIVSLFIMTNTIKLATFNRREEIAIMNMVGATNSFIKTPFVLEGMLLGILGSAIAFLAEWGLYYLMLDKVGASSALSFLQLLPFHDVAIPMVIGFGAVGLLVGVFGSSSAIKNYLRV